MDALYAWYKCTWLFVFHQKFTSIVDSLVISSYKKWKFGTVLLLFKRTLIYISIISNVNQKEILFSITHEY